MPTVKGEEWAKENKTLFFETSAVQGTAVEEAFFEMAKAALKRERSQQITMPTLISIKDEGGALKLEKKDFKKRGETKTQTNCC